jgi:hypothetical protein
LKKNRGKYMKSNKQRQICNKGTNAIAPKYN